jgi:hypothetical protein
MRKCGDCTLCCRLLPMAANSEYRHPAAIAHALAVGLAKPGIPDFDKPAGERCPHQRHGKGCAVYGHHPFGCQIWSCRWLVNDDTADLRRPDRVGYCIDIMPDFVTLDAHDGNPPQNVEAVVIWVDAKRDEAWRDPALIEYLMRRGAEGKIGLIRFNSSDGLAVFPPNMCSDGQWHEIPRTQTTAVAQHPPQELLDGLARCRNVKLAVPK